MIKIENVEVWGFEHAIRGMRNPYDSWSKSDSALCRVTDCYNCDNTYHGKPCFVIGANDLKLMRKLYAAGTEHRKFLRQIVVSMGFVSCISQILSDHDYHRSTQKFRQRICAVRHRPPG